MLPCFVSPKLKVAHPEARISWPTISTPGKRRRGAGEGLGRGEEEEEEEEEQERSHNRRSATKKREGRSAPVGHAQPQPGSTLVDLAPPPPRSVLVDPIPPEPMGSPGRLDLAQA